MTDPAPAPRAHSAAAALLVVEALLVTSPVLAVAQLWLGAQLIGGGARLRILDVVGQGLVLAGGAMIVPLLLVAALGVRRRSRAWAVVALLAQAVVAAHVVVPLLVPYATLARVPGGRVVLAAVAAATTVLLVLALARGPLAAPGRTRGPALGVAVLLALAVTSGAVVGAVRTTLPTYPFGAFLPAGEGQAGGTPVPPDAVPQNPAMAPNPFGSLHNDAWATDSYSLRGPRAASSGVVDSLFTGGDCATITFDSRGRLVTLCSSLRRVDAWVVDPRTLTVLARAQVGERSGALTDFAGGGYFVLDAENRIVLATSDGAIRVVAIRDTPDGVALVPDGEIAVASTLQPGEKVTSVLPDWQGRYWYVGARGSVGVADPRSGRAEAIQLGGESIENSFAVTRDAVYVVTGAALYRIDATADGAPRVVWREPYDTGTRRKPGQTSTASGTTPTVFAGGELVAITDNAEPRLNVVVMRTGREASPRTLCRVPVFDDGHSATENSLIAVGDSLVVENNDGYDPPITSTVGGATTWPGLARVTVDRTGRCGISWSTTALSVPSVVSKASTADGLVYTYSKPGSWWGGDGWYLTAVDVATGSVAWTRLAGGGLSFNNHYAGVALSPAGDLFVGTVHGLAVLRSG